ncbi:hypothetical protein A3Q56_04442, partial [Intoshia linei]
YKDDEGIENDLSDIDYVILPNKLKSQDIGRVALMKNTSVMKAVIIVAKGNQNCRVPTMLDPWCELEVFLQSHHYFKAYNCIMRHWTKKEHPFDIADTIEIAERSLATMGSCINSVKSDTMLKFNSIYDNN